MYVTRCGLRVSRISQPQISENNSFIPDKITYPPKKLASHTTRCSSDGHASTWKITFVKQQRAAVRDRYALVLYGLYWSVNSVAKWVYIFYMSQKSKASRNCGIGLVICVNRTFGNMITSIKHLFRENFTVLFRICQTFNDHLAKRWSFCSN